MALNGKLLQMESVKIPELKTKRLTLTVGVLEQFIQFNLVADNSGLAR